MPVSCLNQRIGRLWRHRSLRKWLLTDSRVEKLAEKRVAAIADMGRFLADPCAFRAAELAGSDGPFDWLTQAHIPWALRAQTHALNGEFAEAARAIQQVLEMLRPRDESAEGRMAVSRPAISPRAFQVRRQLTALAQAFLATALLAQGDGNGAKKQIECACRAQPSIAYLHQVHAEVLMANHEYAEAFDALDRAAVLSGAAQGTGARLNAVVDLAIAAMRAMWAANEDQRGAAAGLLNRAAARLDGVLGQTLDDANANQRAAARFWRGRLALEQEGLRQANREPPEDIGTEHLALGQETRREAIDKAPSADRARAVALFKDLVNMQEAAKDWRDAAEGWLAVARRRPLRALHDRLLRSQGQSDPFRDELVAALIDSINTAEHLEVKHRLVLRIPDDMLGEGDVERLIGRSSGADKDAIDIPAFHAALDDAIGIEPPPILIVRIKGGEPGQVDVYLDGVPIGSETLVDESIKRDWFGAMLSLPRPQAAIAVLAQSVMHHLDRMLDTGHARKLGVGDFPYAAWSPTLRLLLADRTPLHDRARLRSAVAAVAWGGTSPAEAAAEYRRSAVVRLWGAGLPTEAAPDDLLRPLAIAAGRDGRRQAVVLAHDEADRIVQWASGQAEAATAALSFAVSNESVKARPWLRALLRDKLPNYPVLGLDALTATTDTDSLASAQTPEQELSKVAGVAA
jgi:tetratricopeptide (TPR) repeat protein